jgi:hypothetical protein
MSALIPPVVRDTLTDAVRQERLVLNTFWNAPAAGTDWNAGIFRLLELWRRELSAGPAPPSIPEASNYREAQAAVDVFARAVEAAGGTQPPMPQAVGAPSPAGSQANRAEQPVSDQLDRFADPTHCPDPECNAPVPELYRLQSRYVCRACGRWRLHTGVAIMPVAGPPGTRPKYVRVSAPYWVALEVVPPAPSTPTAAAASVPPSDDPPAAVRPLSKPAQEHTALTAADAPPPAAGTVPQQVAPTSAPAAPPAVEAPPSGDMGNGPQREEPPADDPPNPGEIDWQALLLMPPLTASEIAGHLGQPKELVERTLRYFRSQHDYGFIKDDDAGTTDATFRYKMPDVLSHLQKWYVKRRRKGQTRPA